MPWFSISELEKDPKRSKLYRSSRQVLKEALMIRCTTGTEEIVFKNLLVELNLYEMDDFLVNSVYRNLFMDEMARLVKWGVASRKKSPSGIRFWGLGKRFAAVAVDSKEGKDQVFMGVASKQMREYFSVYISSMGEGEKITVNAIRKVLEAELGHVEKKRRHSSRICYWFKTLTREGKLKCERINGGTLVYIRTEIPIK
ncbi:hypothetical protein PV783_13695 [Chitinophaga sp. CC14]|uniref:hypothetical protein n=1 Tax=Chitinophaga sp. CC14 TaxID=3029199 RepID=UPI003B77EF67